MQPTKLRRGFVTEANDWAVDLRREMNLAASDPMCPWNLAKLLGVKVYRLCDLRACPERTLLYERRKGHGFSAAVCFDGMAAFIVMNDINDKKRQASDIAHELAHVLLRHPPANPFQKDGARSFSEEHELEAERLGPTLLISDAAAVRALSMITRGLHSMQSLSDSWGITQEVLQMRINLSGAKRRLGAAA